VIFSGGFSLGGGQIDDFVWWKPGVFTGLYRKSCTHNWNLRESVRIQWNSELLFRPEFFAEFPVEIVGKRRKQIGNHPKNAMMSRSEITWSGSIHFQLGGCGWGWGWECGCRWTLETCGKNAFRSRIWFFPFRTFSKCPDPDSTVSRACPHNPDCPARWEKGDFTRFRTVPQVFGVFASGSERVGVDTFNILYPPTSTLQYVQTTGMKKLWRVDISIDSWNINIEILLDGERIWFLLQKITESKSFTGKYLLVTALMLYLLLRKVTAKSKLWFVNVIKKYSHWLQREWQTGKLETLEVWQISDCWIAISIIYESRKANILVRNHWRYCTFLEICCYMFPAPKPKIAFYRTCDDTKLLIKFHVFLRYSKSMVKCFRISHV
jgi:hypothetical protein